MKKPAGTGRFLPILMLSYANSTPRSFRSHFLWGISKATPLSRPLCVALLLTTKMTKGDLRQCFPLVLLRGEKRPQSFQKVLGSTGPRSVGATEHVAGSCEGPPSCQSFSSPLLFIAPPPFLPSLAFRGHWIWIKDLAENNQVSLNFHFFKYFLSDHKYF